MKRVLALIFLSATLAQANDEITIELPGGVPLEMVWIEPGSFIMGQGIQEVTIVDNEVAPQMTPREVTISQGFYLGKYEITQEQWQAVMGTAPWSSVPNDYQGPRHPAIGITWYDAQAFAQRLNDHFGEDAYRLPTEAEWEYACRAGTTTRWFFGDDDSLLASYAWYKTVHPRPVGEKLPNPWGLFDIYGNAWEWIHDWYDYGYNYDGSHDGTPQTEPSPVLGHYRIHRGGSFRWNIITPALRMYILPYNHGYGDTGARLLKGAPLTNPFLPDSSASFFPAHEGNVWIMRSHTYTYSGPPPPNDTTAYVLESRVIDGNQYWDMELIGKPFRLDESGNIWIRQDSLTSEGIRDFLMYLDERSELRESQYYQQSSRFRNLAPDQEDLLLYDFNDAVLDPLNPNSPTWELDYEVSSLYSSMLQRAVGLSVQKSGRSTPYHRLFWYEDESTEFNKTLVFQRGLGTVRMVEAVCCWVRTSELLWARIDGKEYGLHPGPGYPGYREVITAVASPELTSAQPATSGLSPNYPNPFNASTQIAYHLAAPGPVRLTIYNVLGQPVHMLVNQFQTAGFYQVRWDARDQRGTALAAGVYLVRLHYPGGEQTRRLLLLK